MKFADIDELRKAYDQGFVDLHAKVTVRINESEINFDNSKTSKVDTIEKGLVKYTQRQTRHTPWWYYGAKESSGKIRKLM